MKATVLSSPTKDERTLLEGYLGKDTTITFLLCGQERSIETVMTEVGEYGISFVPHMQYSSYIPFSGARSCGILSVTASPGGEVLYSSRRN